MVRLTPLELPVREGNPQMLKEGKLGLPYVTLCNTELLGRFGEEGEDTEWANLTLVTTPNFFGKATWLS